MIEIDGVEWEVEQQSFLLDKTGVEEMQLLYSRPSPATHRTRQHRVEAQKPEWEDR